MARENRIARVWSDPVWSKVIGGAILALLAFLVAQLRLVPVPSFAIVSPGMALGVGLVGFAAIAALWLWSRRRPKVLVFLSAGGTCRDPMAAAIMAKVLQAKPEKRVIVIRAAGLGPNIGSQASYAARYVMNRMYGEDLLKNHKPELLTPELAAEADLIVAMDKGLLLTAGKTLPGDKTFVLKEFLGLRGDISDPWPDGRDDATLARYQECAEELRRVLTAGADRLLAALEV